MLLAWQSWTTLIHNMKWYKKIRWPFFFVIFVLFVCLFLFLIFFHIQEGTILFMWVERQGVQKVNSTCIWKRNNKEGWQTVARKMWVSEFLLSLYNGSSSFVFYASFYLWVTTFWPQGLRLSDVIWILLFATPLMLRIYW